MITPESIERIKITTILDVVRHYVADLKKNGTAWKACSPFTQEKTPSFFVVPAKNIFKDFSSGHGGDVVKFVMLYNNMEWIDAIKEIANITGERLEYTHGDKADQEKETEREALYKLNQAAATHYGKQLLELDATHPAFKDLIDKRIYQADTLLQWEIGYAPDQWQFLTDKLHEKALIKPAMDLGIVKEKDGRHYDAFRHRIMFPIHDVAGRVVGFGGRHLAPDQHNPKYLNTGDTVLYNKSQVLYGLHFAISAIREMGHANLMEGYTDVISFHQAGMANTVGTCGTSLTEEQCKLLRKYTHKVVQFPDPDAAGESAAQKNIDLLMRHGMEVVVVPLPKLEGRKVDPDELTRIYRSVSSVEL